MLTDKTTPYGKMFDWLSSDPFTSNLIENNNGIEDSLKERSVLALAFFSLTETSSFTACAPFTEGMSLGNDEDEENCKYQYTDAGTDEKITEMRKRWVSNTDHCDWGGIKCIADPLERRNLVEGSDINITTQLDLPGMNLAGSLPSEIGLLTRLVVFNLQSDGSLQNYITGSIPTEIGELTDLQVFKVNGNQMTGEIPDQLYELEQLQKVNIGFNKFSGQISSKIKQLTGLMSFFASNNRITGSIPTHIGLLTRMEKIYLSDNELSGTFPSEIGELVELDELWLSNCTGLSGSLPTEIGNLKKMIKFYVNSNKFSKNIPETLYNMANLTNLDLYKNDFTGTISQDIIKLSELGRLLIFDNRFNGTLPIEIGSLQNLKYLYTHYNDFVGNVSTGICDTVITGISADCSENPDTGKPKIKCICCNSCCQNSASRTCVDM